MADAAPARVLVVGGTGVFGQRLVQGLLETTDLDVIVGGRDAARLAAFAERWNGDAGFGERSRVTCLRLDALRVTAETLRAAGPIAVVDAAGPYQGGRTRLARAAIAARLHYVDLADARDFVARFAPELDRAARAAGVVALTGASSTPALSNAALDTLTAGWREVHRVQVAISPGNRAPRGLSVIRSILSYAGQPVRAYVEGGWRELPGWGVTVRRELPGVGRRWLGLVETPDLDIIPRRFGVRDTALFRAGLEVWALHLGLLLASFAVRAGLITSLQRFAGPFRAVAILFARLGTDRGGMLVEAEGLDAEARSVRGTWSLVAKEGDGPFIPTLPALAAVRALAAGGLVQPGASACVGVLSLEAIEVEFRPYHIETAIRWERPGPSLYQIVLGEAFQRLPEPLRIMHQPGWGLRAYGEASVDGADGALAHVVARLFRLPRAASLVAVAITMRQERPGQERWRRTFGGRRFSSTLSAARAPGRLLERFGPFSFELDLPVGPEGVLGMPVRGWRLGPITLPSRLAPVSTAREYVDDRGRFCFDVEMRLPLGLGRLVHYRGWLLPRSPGNSAGDLGRVAASQRTRTHFHDG